MPQYVQAQHVESTHVVVMVLLFASKCMRRVSEVICCVLKFTQRTVVGFPVLASLRQSINYIGMSCVIHRRTGKHVDGRPIVLRYLYFIDYIKCAYPPSEQ